MRYIAAFLLAFTLTAGAGLTAQQARLQVIHNAADPGASVVDIYLNGNILLDDFAFRAATPFIDVTAGVPQAIGVAPGNSTGAQDIIVTFTPTFTAGKTYIAVANGVLDPTMFAANPDMKTIAFTLFSADDGREIGTSPANVDLKVLHGATDAPAVDVIARGVGTLVNDAAYGDFTPYLSVPANNYALDITPGNDNNTIVASFGADVSTLGGGAAVVFASGFLNPAANQNGAAFGLFAALPNGTVIALPAIAPPTARLQVIHNAADPAASVVDIYLNGSLLLDDFAFRAATPFVDVPAEVQIAIGVAPGNSTGAQDIITTFTPTLTFDETYIAVANGVLDPTMFAANPDMKSIGFTLFTAGDGRESGTSPANVDLKVLHGATDAPAVDVIARGVGTLVNDAAYGDFTPYISVPAGSYILDITPANANSTVVASFAADLSGLGGGAAVVFASGFLNPAANQNGLPFGLFAALPNGTVVALPLSVFVDVKPGECPNSFNVRSKGKLPVAVLGTSWFDVAAIDASTVTLNGVSPTGNAEWKDVAAPFMGVPSSCYDCNSGTDYIKDLGFRFERQTVLGTLGMVSNNDCVPVTVTGMLSDGRSFVGMDYLDIIKTGKGRPKAASGVNGFDLALEQNSPNPVLSGTNFQYSLPEAASVTLEVFNALGQRVATVYSGLRDAGVHVASWSGLSDAGSALPAGNYIYRLQAGGQVISRMLVIAR